MAWSKIILAGDSPTELTGTAYRTLLLNSTGAVTELAHSATTGDVLTSNGAAADPTWQTPAAGAHALGAGQSDVTITTVVEGEILKMNGASTWINQTLAEAGIAAASHGTHLTAGSVGNTELNNTATDIALAQLILTPAVAGTGTTEGTVFYDSDDNHLYVYVV